MTLNNKNNKILLALLPFWDSQIPPLGIACLKSSLQEQGFNVKTIDANVEIKFREATDHYFNTLKEYVPGNKRGNFKSIGHDVLRNHMMAHLNYQDEQEYIRLVKIIVERTFFIEITTLQVNELTGMVREFFEGLRSYLIELLEKEKPSFLGLSVFSGTLPASLFAFKLAKSTYPHIKTVMGGGIFADDLAPGSENIRLFLEKTPYIDKIIIGEGEILFLKLLKGELPETQRVFSLKDIGGEIQDLANALVPDFSDFNLQYYPYPGFYGSRSCPFQCKFCSAAVQWGKYRKKGAKQIARELIKMYETYNTQLFLLVDSLLNPLITDLGNEFNSQGHCIYWDGSLRVEKSFSNVETVLNWRKAGFYRARLGIESGSQKTLTAMGKGVKVEDMKNTLRSLAAAGIKTTTYWIVGYPGETEADFRQTLDFIAELKDDIYEADFRPFFYYKTGQVQSAQWREKYKTLTLYPGNAKETLIVQTWILDAQPGREETYRRLSRFKETLEKLGIPNIYSLYEIYKADERWKKLHKNAVPSLVEFKDSGNYIDECKHITGSSRGEAGAARSLSEEDVNKISLFNIVTDGEEYDFD